MTVERWRRTSNSPAPDALRAGAAATSAATTRSSSWGSGTRGAAMANSIRLLDSRACCSACSGGSAAAPRPCPPAALPPEAEQVPVAARARPPSPDPLGPSGYRVAKVIPRPSSRRLPAEPRRRGRGSGETRESQRSRENRGREGGKVWLWALFLPKVRKEEGLAPGRFESFDSLDGACLSLC